MAIYEYKGLSLNIPDQNTDHKGFFDAAREHRLVVKKCLHCGLLIWPPGHGCPRCASIQWEWHQVSGKGTIYSYQIVTHPILPGFREWVPYPAVLVELDEQRGIPTTDDGLRIIANLVDENFNPEKEENVAIGKRVEVVFLELDNGFSIPQFKLSQEPPQGSVWRYPV